MLWLSCQSLPFQECIPKLCGVYVAVGPLTSMKNYIFIQILNGLYLAQKAHTRKNKKKPQFIVISSPGPINNEK